MRSGGGTAHPGKCRGINALLHFSAETYDRIINIYVFVKDLDNILNKYTAVRS